MSKEPFTKEESEIMDLLVKAHNKFIKLNRTHPNEIQEWITPFHLCQGILINRVVRRDYPGHFNKC